EPVPRSKSREKCKQLLHASSLSFAAPIEKKLSRIHAALVSGSEYGRLMMAEARRLPAAPRPTPRPPRGVIAHKCMRHKDEHSMFSSQSRNSGCNQCTLSSIL